MSVSEVILVVEDRITVIQQPGNEVSLPEGETDVVTVQVTEKVINVVGAAPQGPPGPAGANGVGVPPGGLDGQVLTKQSNADFDTDWEAAPPPGLHATSHEDGGADEVTLAQSQVTNLVTDLAGKSNVGHTHTASDITDFAEVARDTIGTALVQGANITITVDDPGDTITIAASGGGGGSLTVSEDGTPVDTTVTTIDFGNGLDVTESPEDEVNVVVDLGEYTGADLPVTGGGTGASSASAALSNLGGQPLDSDLTTIAGLSASSGNFIVGVLGVWSAQNPAAVRATLDLEVGVDVQAFSADLTSLATNWIQASAAGPSSLDFHEDTDNGSNRARLIAPASMAADRTITLPDATTTLVGQDTSEVLSNKIINLSSNTLNGTTANFNTALNDGDFATLAGTETLTNKTLTDPKVTYSINAQTGTTYTTVLTDASKLVTLSNASAITLTIPANSSVAYATGTSIDFIQIGAGQVTVVGAGGVTVNGTPGLLARAQHSGFTAIKIGTDTWSLVGDLAA